MIRLASATRPCSLVIAFLGLLLVSLPVQSPAHALGTAGTIEGSVVDPSGGVVAKAEVSIHNAVTGYTQSAVSAPDGSFRLVNLPPNPYRLDVKASGFGVFSQAVDIRNAVPVQVKVTLALAGATTSVTVEGVAEALENDPSAHVDVDRSLILKLPPFYPACCLNHPIP